MQIFNAIRIWLEAHPDLTTILMVVVAIFGAAGVLWFAQATRYRPSPVVMAWDKYERVRDDLIGYLKEVQYLQSVDAANQHDMHQLERLKTAKEEAYQQFVEVRKERGE